MKKKTNSCSLIPGSRCARTGLTLWLSVAAVILLMAWLSAARDSHPRSPAETNGTGPKHQVAAATQSRPQG